MKANKSFVSWSGGVIDSLGRYIHDYQAYYNTALKIENFDCTRFGGVKKSYGTRFIAETKNNGKAILIPFEFSVSEYLDIIVGAGWYRFATKDGVILTGDPASELEYPNSFSESDLEKIRYYQFNNIVYLVGESFAPIEIIRNSNTDWTIQEISFDYPPLLPIEPKEITMQLGATTGSTTLTASGNHFTANEVGSIYELSHQRSDNQLFATVSSTGSGNSSAIDILGSWSFISYSPTTFQGSIELQRKSKSSSTWVSIESYNTDSGIEVNKTGIEEEDDIQYRVKWNVTAGSVSYQLTTNEFYRKALVKVTGYTSATQVNVEVINDASSTDTTDLWRESAFSEKNGYPTSITIFGNRLYLAGNEIDPKRVWGSRIALYQDFREGQFSTDAINFVDNESGQSRIRWMGNVNSLSIGTSSSEFVVNGGLSNTPISSSSISIRRQSSRGSAPIASIVVGNRIAYVQRGSKTIRSFYYVYNENAYRSADLTTLNGAVGNSGIKKMDVQESPLTTLWVVNGEGLIWKLILDEDEEIRAWSSIKTDGKYIDISVKETESGTFISCIVEREIEGVTKRYLEYFEDDWYFHSGLSISLEKSGLITSISTGNKCVVQSVSHGLASGDTIRISDTSTVNLNGLPFVVEKIDNDSFYIKNLEGYYINSSDFAIEPSIAGSEEFEVSGNGDSVTGNGDIITGESVIYGRWQDSLNELTGLDHLNGKKISCIADGVLYTDILVSNGKIELPQWVSNVELGLPYESKLKTNQLILSNEGSQSIGRPKSICSAYVMVENTRGRLFFEYDSTLQKRVGINFTSVYSGMKELDYNEQAGIDTNIEITHADPFKCVLLGLAVDYKVT